MARPKSIPNRAELIVEAADELFARYGFERTSIEDIARHLNIGKGSIYLDFRTKEDILCAILEKYCQETKAKLEKAVDECELPALGAFKAIYHKHCLDVYDYITRDFHTPESLLHTSVALKGRFKHFHEAKRQTLVRLLRKAADNKEISPSLVNDETARIIFMTISCLFPPYFNNYSESETRITREELAERANSVFDLVVAGLANL